MNDERTVDVGPYPLRLPDFWYEAREVREKPGFFGFDAIATPGFSFGFYVLVGRGADAGERERLLEAQVRGKGAQRRRAVRQHLLQGAEYETSRRRAATSCHCASHNS
jgi:hypothetical protein